MSRRDWYPACRAATEKRRTLEVQEGSKAFELYEEGAQCLACRHYLELPPPTGSDFGVCLLPTGEYLGLVVFEHFTCKDHEYPSEEEMIADE